MGRMLDSIIEAPTAKEIEEDDYYDGLRESGHGNQGRSLVTGY
jgi:hypothetical protein